MHNCIAGEIKLMPSYLRYKSGTLLSAATVSGYSASPWNLFPGSGGQNKAQQAGNKA
jgi:hypothetical protein